MLDWAIISVLRPETLAETIPGATQGPNTRDIAAESPSVPVPYSVQAMVVPQSPRSVAGCTVRLALLGALPRTSSGSWGHCEREVPQRHGHFSLQGPPGDSLENACGHDRRIRCTVRCPSADCLDLFSQTLTTKLPPGRNHATLRRHGNGGMAFHCRLRHQPTIPKNQSRREPLALLARDHRLPLRANNRFLETLPFPFPPTSCANSMTTYFYCRARGSRERA